MKTKSLLVLSLLTFVLIAINLQSIYDSNNHNVLDIVKIATRASANQEQGSDRIWLMVPSNTIVFEEYTLSEGCPDGQVRNCVRTFTTTTISCVPGGSDPCYPGTQTFTNYICGDCF